MEHVNDNAALGSDNLNAGQTLYMRSPSGRYPMPFSVAQGIDIQLQSFPPYVGAINLDIGNPLHLSLFKPLLDCVYFDRNGNG